MLIIVRIMRDEQLIDKIFMSYNFSLGFDAPIYLWRKQACKYVTAESDIYIYRVGQIKWHHLTFLLVTN